MEVQTRRATDWVTFDEARAEFGFSRTLLRNWRTNGISILHGQKLPMVFDKRSFQERWEDGTMRNVPVFCRRTLNKATVAIARSVNTDKNRWGTARELALEFH